MTSLAFLDTETTSLDSETGEIFELAYLMVPDASNLDEWFARTWWLQVDEAQASPESLEITRYHERNPLKDVYCRCSFEWSESSDGIKETVGTVHFNRPYEVFVNELKDAHLFGAVPAFDDRFLRKWLAREHYEIPYHYQIHDIEDIAAGYIHGRNHTVNYDEGISFPYDSDYLAKRLCATQPEKDRHTAMGDVKLTYRLYRKIFS
jgi:hypothetical protein